MLGRLLFLLAVAVSCCFCFPYRAVAQSWGDRGGDRGDRGSWGGDRGSWGGFRGGPSPFGGSPFGGPGGGFNPADMIRRADTNNNNTLEPDEMQNGFGRFVQRMAERAGLNTRQSLRVDEVISAVERSRGGSSGSSSSSSGYSGSYPSSSSSSSAATNPQGFGTQAQVTLVPGFDGPGTGSGAAGSSTSTSSLPLEQRFDSRILERARDRMRDYDRNGNGTLEADELTNYRGDPPIMTSDVNKDGVISLEEMCLRYQARYGGSSSGSSSGWPGSSSSSSPYSSSYGSRSPSSSSSSYGGSSYGYRSPTSSSSSPSYTSSSSSSPSSSSSSNDRAKEFAQRTLQSNDRNRNGKLEKDEWGGVRSPEDKDTNKDGVITLDEMTTYYTARMSGGGDRGSDRGSFFRGGPPGGGPPFGGGWGGGPPGGGPPFGSFGGGPPGGWGGDRGDRGDRGRDYSRGDSSRGDSRSSDYSRSRDSSRGSDSSRGDSGGSNSTSSRGSDPAAPKTSYRVATPTELLPAGLDSWFTRGDTDGDGQVSMAEYSTKWDADVAKKFQALDTNGDGFISANEALRGGPSSRR